MKRGWLASLLAAAVVLPFGAERMTPRLRKRRRQSAEQFGRHDHGQGAERQASAVLCEAVDRSAAKDEDLRDRSFVHAQAQGVARAARALEAQQRDQIKAVLTPEQQEKLKTLIAEARTGTRHERPWPERRRPHAKQVDSAQPRRAHVAGSSTHAEIVRLEQRAAELIGIRSGTRMCPFSLRPNTHISRTRTLSRDEGPRCRGASQDCGAGHGSAPHIRLALMIRSQFPAAAVCPRGNLSIARRSKKAANGSDSRWLLCV